MPTARTNVLKIFKDSPILSAIAFALLFLFLLVQVHEFIPFLHHDKSPDIPEEYCPLCVIKYILSLAIVFSALVYITKKLFIWFTPTPIDLRPLRLAVRSLSRAPPVFRLA